MNLEPLTEKLQFIPDQIKNVNVFRDKQGEPVAMLFDVSWTGQNLVKMRLENLGHAQCLTIVAENIPGQLQVTQLEIYPNNPAILNMRSGIQNGSLEGNSYAQNLFYPTHFFQYQPGGLNISTAHMQNVHTNNKTIRFNRVSTIGDDGKYIHHYAYDRHNEPEENVLADQLIHLLTAQVTNTYGDNRTPTTKKLLFDPVECGDLFTAINQLPKRNWWTEHAGLN